jgi:dTDP-glucose pyrophosphorylase
MGQQLTGCTVIVLAGGQGKRMGRLGRFSAKAALSAYDQPLLLRLINQIHVAGFQRVMVSTDPVHFSQLKALISSYMERDAGTNSHSFDIQVFENSAHSNGALEALAEVLRHIKTSRCLMCLGDIFFRDNPFLRLVAEVNGIHTCLGVAQPVDPYELMQGGIVRCHDQEIVAVIERPQPAYGDELRWSGIALFGRELGSDLEAFLEETPNDSPLGDLFEFYRKRGHLLRAILVPDFVNVNSPDHLLLASLYVAIESHHGATTLQKALVKAAKQLRSTLARAEQVETV